jgi:altronate dehydratase small subunit
MNQRALLLNAKDNVAILLDSAGAGDPVTLLDPDGRERGAIESRDAIDPYHKIAVRAIPEGEPIVKLGEVIGRAMCPITGGDHVHVHNAASARLAGGGR